MTTAELLYKCANRDKNAWDEFIKLYHNLVVNSVRYKLNKLGSRVPKSEYLDIVQEIFLSIWEKNKLAEIENPACLKSWLIIVSLNATAGYCRKKSFHLTQRTFSLDAAVFSDNTYTKFSDIIPCSKLNTTKILETNELHRTLEQEISKLPPKQQVALKFNIYENKKQREVAEIMNIPLKTVSTLISRAKKTLKTKLQEILKE